MTRLSRRASLLVAFWLLTSAATAYADCAWVVWRQTLSDNPAIPPSGNWITETAFKSKEDCVRDIEQKRGVYFGEAKLEGYTYTRGAYASPTPWTRAGRRGSERNLVPIHGPEEDHPRDQQGHNDYDSADPDHAL